MWEGVGGRKVRFEGRRRTLSPRRRATGLETVASFILRSAQAAGRAAGGSEQPSLNPQDPAPLPGCSDA